MVLTRASRTTSTPRSCTPAELSGPAASPTANRRGLTRKPAASSFATTASEPSIRV
ncbi:MAG: hypothetical protein KC933_01150 [Myxococcales bacterium]|nr:hypothetical protein [Myxococcales bacterium]